MVMMFCSPLKKMLDGIALTKACNASVDQDALHLARAAEIVRWDIFSTMWHSDGSLQFTSGCQEKFVPQALLVLVNMILKDRASMCSQNNRMSQQL
jgi:hypothetical protein